MFADKLANVLGSRKRAGIVLVGVFVCLLLLAGVRIYYAYFKLGHVTPLNEIPSEVLQTMTPEQIQYVKDHS